jgi:hypothetical protein
MDKTQLASTTPHLEMDLIVADADYYNTKARQCARLAARSTDGAAAETLRSLAAAFEQKARSLDEDN